MSKALHPRDGAESGVSRQILHRRPVQKGQPQPGRASSFRDEVCVDAVDRGLIHGMNRGIDCGKQVGLETMIS